MKSKLVVLRNRNSVERRLAEIWTAARLERGVSTRDREDLRLRFLLVTSFVAGLRTGLKVATRQMQGVVFFECQTCETGKLGTVAEVLGRGAKARLRAECGTCGERTWVK